MNILYVILIVIIFFSVLYFFLKHYEKFRKYVYRLFLEAENFIEKNQKMDYVLDNVYDYLPKIIKIFVSEKLLKKIAQKLFDAVADFLNNGKVELF